MDLHTAPLDTNAMLTVWIALSQAMPARARARARGRPASERHRRKAGD
jgi:hypothetical protein